MTNNKPHVLITGGCGFVGSNLVIELLNRDYTVDIFDDLSNGRLEFFAVELLGERPNRKTALKEIDFIFEKEIALQRVSSGNYDFVFHLAANPRPSLSIEEPLKSYDDNVRLSLEFLDAVRLSQENHDMHTKFIFASSSAVYGESTTGPSLESIDTNPISPYGLEKKNVEEMMDMYSKIYGINSVALRYFNVYGKNQLASPKYPCVIAAWIKAALNKEVIVINGDGTVQRDFVHVDDVVNATIKAAERDIQGFEVFNVGTGYSYSLNELHNKLDEITGLSIPFQKGNLRNGDVDITCAQISLMKNELGIEPKTLSKGLRETYNWAKDSWCFKNLKINI